MCNVSMISSADSYAALIWVQLCSQKGVSVTRRGRRRGRRDVLVFWVVNVLLSRCRWLCSYVFFKCYSILTLFCKSQFIVKAGTELRDLNFTSQHQWRLEPFNARIVWSKSKESAYLFNCLPTALLCLCRRNPSVVFQLVWGVVLWLGLFALPSPIAAVTNPRPWKNSPGIISI